MCGGDGCAGCKDLGYTLVEDCPQKRLDGSVWTAVRCARLLNKGIPPIAGGILDQSNHFADAFDQISAEENAWRHKLKIPE